MKSKLQNLLFLLMIIISFINFDLNSLHSINNKFKNLKSFKVDCFYYDIKTDLIIENYVEKIRLIVDDIFIKHIEYSRDNISFEQFWAIFKEGKYGLIAPELSKSEEYVRFYYNYFKKSVIMTEADLLQFMGLYILEGELLINHTHPTLSKYYQNVNQVSDTKSCNVTLFFWELVNQMLMKIYVKYEWNDETPINKIEIFKILSETIAGKCWLTNDKDCNFFSSEISKAHGFFNLSGGNPNELNVYETKMMYATYLFRDISVDICDQKIFNPIVINQKAETIISSSY